MRKDTQPRVIPKRKHRQASFEVDDELEGPADSAPVPVLARARAVGASDVGAGAGAGSGSTRPPRKRRSVEFDHDDMDSAQPSARSKSAAISSPPGTGAAAGNAPKRRRKPDTVFDEDEMEDVSDDDILAIEDTEMQADGEAEAEAEIGSPNDEPEGSDAYKLFLHSLLENPEENIIETSEKGLAALLDDDADDDFNYLMESAVVEDDPLEYYTGRSVHVSAQEISQLVQQNDEPLRPRTRRVNSINRNKHPNSNLNMTASGNSRSSSGTRIGPGASGSTRAIIPQLPQISQVPQSMALGAGSGGSAGPGPLITNQEVNATKDQYAQLAHLVAAVHADACRIIATSTPAEQESETTLPERDLESAKTACTVLGKMADDLESKRDTSLNFWKMVMPYHAHHVEALRGGDAFTYTPPENSEPAQPQTCSMFDAPGISNLKQVLQDSQSTQIDWSKVSPVDFAFKVASNPIPIPVSMPGLLPGVLPGVHPIVNTLKLQPVKSQLSKSEKPDSSAPWTLADDALLLMVLHKHTRDFGQAYKDLLPHRTEADCNNRCNYLKSRRCSDNPIKRFLMNNNAPLSKKEIDKLKDIFKQRGKDAEKDDKLWKSIQRDLFPTREVSMLKKLWTVREKRRNYKVKYRKKAKELEEKEREKQAATANANANASK